MKGTSQVVMFDLFLRYRYRYRDPLGNPGPYYFPKTEISSHKYALEYKEWKLIVKTYLKHVLNHLKAGLAYKLPHGLGYWQFVKKRELRNIMKWKEGAQMVRDGTLERGTFLKEKKMFFNGFYPRLYWYRDKKNGVTFKNMNKVKVNLIKGTWAEYWRQLKDPKTAHMLYNLNDA